jgi:hypothetical protein
MSLLTESVSRILCEGNDHILSSDEESMVVNIMHKLNMFLTWVNSDGDESV